MSFYTALRQTANGLLSSKGQRCTLSVITPGTYNPATGASVPTSVDHAVIAAVFDFPQKEIDGSLVLTGDKKVLISAEGLTATPEPAHKFTDIAGSVYTIVNARATAPAGTVVMWTLQVRA